MSLELSGKVTGNIRSYGAKADSRNEGKVAHVKLDLTLNEEQAQALGGKPFARTCFNDFAGKSGAASVTHKKLGGELAIKADHSLVIEEYPISTKPKITDVLLSDKERVVTLTLKLEIPFVAKKLRHLLDDCTGDDIEIEFKGVTQTEIGDAKKTEEDDRMDFSEAEEGNGADEETGEQPEPMWDDADLDAVEAEA